MKKTWPYDAAQRDPLTKLRIPVTTSHPEWRYIACFDRESEARPTDAETKMLVSFIGEYKEYYFNDWYKAKLLERPLDTEERVQTVVFHKWAENDWSYRRTSWQYGPFWVPVNPRLRKTALDYKDLPAMTLEQVMDTVHTVAGEPMEHWLVWKAQHPDAFPTHEGQKL